MSLPPHLAAALAGTAGLAALAGATTYAAVSSQSQLFGPILVAPPLPQQVALTFDDGPNPSATPQLLDVLAVHGVRATFFLIGAHVLREPALTRRIAAAGHSIGNHTMTHPWLPRHSARRIREELTSCNRVLEDTLGAPVHLFRPPHGARRPAVLRTARALRLQTVGWNIILGDWKPTAPAALHTRMAAAIQANQRRGRGSNLVLHDGGQHTPTADRRSTVKAVALLLAGLSKSTSFVTPPGWTL